MNESYCAVYLRVSTSGQSVESQERAIRSYMEQNGINRYKVFTDHGVSGAKASRPALDELINEVKARKVHTVITFSLSRLGRNVRNLLELVELFKEYTVVLVSITERIDDSPVGRLLLAILGALSAMELEYTRSRVLAGLANARAKGKVLGRVRTVNYDLILELHSKGYNNRKIAQLVKCDPSTVSKILKLNKPSPES